MLRDTLREQMIAVTNKIQELKKKKGVTMITGTKRQELEALLKELDELAPAEKVDKFPEILGRALAILHNQEAEEPEEPEAPLFRMCGYLTRIKRDGETVYVLNGRVPLLVTRDMVPDLEAGLNGPCGVRGRIQDCRGIPAFRVERLYITDNIKN